MMEKNAKIYVAGHRGMVGSAIVRELKRQMETSLYERLLLSSGTENKERVLELALNGNEITKPSDIIKDPYVRIILTLE